MLPIEEEISRRENAARAAMKKVLGNPEDQWGATGFITHHLEVLDPKYWRKHLSTNTPSLTQVFDLLAIKRHWGGDAEIDVFDFGLPGAATDYVIAVKFDNRGDIVEITMES